MMEGSKSASVPQPSECFGKVSSERSRRTEQGHRCVLLVKGLLSLMHCGNENDFTKFQVPYTQQQGESFP